MANDILFKFPQLDYVYCLFQGRPDKSQNEELGWGSSDSAKIMQEKLFADYARTGLSSLSACHQVHGTAIIREPEPLNDTPQEADGMSTAVQGKGLLIKTADCQPILFSDSSGQYIMAIHSGWRGNRACFPFLAVQKFCALYNLHPENIFAVRGPSLCPECSEFINFDKEWGSDFQQWFNGQNRCVNLWELTKAQIKMAGVPEKQIFSVDLCTAENSDRFFSYRKDRKCGRQGSIIWIGK